MSNNKKYIVALDQGTTSSRAVVIDKDSNIVATCQRELTTIYPHPGWVEQNAMDIWATQSSTLVEVLAKSNITANQVVALSITNQRETVIVWEKATGNPIYSAISWQCRRTTDKCDQLKQQGYETLIRSKTGLVIDPYFSATKLQWILDQVPGSRERAKKGEILFGTVDTWLIWKMTNGAIHATDYTNASRTMLFNIHSVQWDEALLEIFDIPHQMLPTAYPSMSAKHFGSTPIISGKGDTDILIPIAGVAGDQQAALFGHLCVKPGMVKNTYGTGCFLLMNTGKEAVQSNNGLLTTMACCLSEKEIFYALEGAVFNAGAAIKWLRDGIRIIGDAADTAYYAEKVMHDVTYENVYMVPAFTGLGAPHWDPGARGGLFGLTPGVKREHIIRATLDSIAYQTRDVVDAMREDAQKVPLRELHVDGGASANNFLMQFQADILNTKVVRALDTESTALGSAYLAGLATKFWHNIEALQALQIQKKERHTNGEFTPIMDATERDKLYQGWQKAVERVRTN